MTRITMTKKGIGTVVMEQNEVNGVKVYTITVNGITLSLESATAMNLAYRQYIANGYTVKPAKEEKKVASPVKPVKNDKPATPRFKWNKAGKKVWAIQASIYKRYFQETCKELKDLKGREYHDRLDAMVKAEMKVFEAKMANVVNANI